MRGKRPMHVLRMRRLAKATVEVGHEHRRIAIGRRDRVDAAQPQLLDQTILQRLVGALDAPFGVRGVGADDVDVELIKGAPELRQTSAHRPLCPPKEARASAVILVSTEPFPIGRI